MDSVREKRLQTLPWELSKSKLKWVKHAALWRSMYQLGFASSYSSWYTSSFLGCLLALSLYTISFLTQLYIFVCDDCWDIYIYSYIMLYIYTYICWLWHAATHCPPPVLIKLSTDRVVRLCCAVLCYFCILLGLLVEFVGAGERPGHRKLQLSASYPPRAHAARFGSLWAFLSCPMPQLGWINWFVECLFLVARRFWRLFVAFRWLSFDQVLAGRSCPFERHVKFRACFLASKVMLLLNRMKAERRIQGMVPWAWTVLQVPSASKDWRRESNGFAIHV